MEPWSESLLFRTLRSRFEDLGHPSRKKKWLFPRRNLPIKYKDLSKTNGRTLFQFYLDRGGGHEAFNLFFPNSDTYSGEYVGTGDGSTLIFNLPSKQAASYTLYVDNVAKTGGGADYTFSSEGGADGADKVTFTVAPASGARITFTFTGYLKIRATFKEDNLDFETFYDRLVNVGMQIQGELNE
jgi:hypothetical protein